MKAGAVVNAVGYPDSAAMLKHEFLANGEPEAGSICGDAETRLEDAGKKFIRYPASVVDHLDQGNTNSIAPGSADSHYNSPAAGRMTNRIANQVQNDLTDAFLVPRNHWEFVLNFECHGNTCLLCDGRNKLDTAAHGGGQVDAR